MGRPFLGAAVRDYVRGRCWVLVAAQLLACSEHGVWCGDKNAMATADAVMHHQFSS